MVQPWFNCDDAILVRDVGFETLKLYRALPELVEDWGLNFPPQPLKMAPHPKSKNPKIPRLHLFTF